MLLEGMEYEGRAPAYSSGLKAKHKAPTYHLASRHANYLETCGLIASTTNLPLDN